MCTESKNKQQPGNHPLCSELLNDVTKPVTFARSAGSGGDICTIHMFIYIYRRIAQHGTASVGRA